MIKSSLDTISSYVVFDFLRNQNYMRKSCPLIQFNSIQFKLRMALNKYKAILIASCILPCQQVTAETMGREIQQPNWDWVGSLSVGPVWQSGGTTQTFYLTSDIEKTYTANKKTQALFAGEFFLGLQK